MSEGVYLAAFLEPLAPWLEQEDVTDILVNRPGEVWIDRLGGGLERKAAPALTEALLTRLARQIAASSHQGVNREQPLLSAVLPDGARVQIIGPPATRGFLALAVRKHAIADLSLAQLDKAHLFAPTPSPSEMHDDETLAALLAAGETREFLRRAVRAKKTMVISGGTATGKTTLVNALLKEIDPGERLIVIEDAPELKLSHDNAVGLIAARGEQGEARVDVEDLLAAALRLRPDRILLGELRGKEAFSFLRAVNTGHPGSITTVHADSPGGAVDQIALLALTSGVDLGWSLVRDYVRQVVDVIVQMRRIDGERRITDVEFRPASKRSPSKAN